MLSQVVNLSICCYIGPDPVFVKLSYETLQFRDPMGLFHRKMSVFKNTKSQKYIFFHFCNVNVIFISVWFCSLVLWWRWCSEKGRKKMLIRPSESINLISQCFDFSHYKCIWWPKRQPFSFNNHPAAANTGGRGGSVVRLSPPCSNSSVEWVRVSPSC